MRVALYARVSTDEQAIRGLSIEAQLAALREWAKDKAIVDEYVDLGVSARKPILKRPDLQRLLRDVDAGRIDMIAFTKLDRWTRNVREYYKAQDVLDAHNVSWRAIHEDYETETAAGRLKVNIMLAVAQDEADRTSERVKAVFAEKRRKGLTVNGHMPLGIKFESGVMSPSEDAGKVEALFREYIARRSTSALVPRSEAILGRAYSEQGIRSMLRNERYLEAGVIDPETWATVTAIRETRSFRHGRTNRVYLFAGILVCPECHRRMIAKGVEVGGHEYIYYRCGRSRDSRCDYGRFFKEEDVEAYLLKRVLRAVDGYNLKLARKQKKPVNVTGIQKKLDKLTDLYLEDKISKEDFDARSEPFRDALKSAQTAPRSVDREQIVSALDVYPGLTKAAKKAFWSALVRSVVPTGNGFDITLF